LGRKQLWFLFLCNLVHWSGANGLVPLLPVYANRLGADPAVTGYFLAVVYLGLASGSVAAGWLSDRFQRRKGLYIAAGIANVLVNWLMGRATSVGQLTVLMTLSGFLIGMGLALLNILAGLFVERNERGRVFGILGMTGALGAFVGGLTVGPAADRWGYPHMLTLLALYYILWPVLGSFLQDKTVDPGQTAHPLTTQRGPGLGGAFYLLLLAHVVVTVSSFVSAMGKTLSMDGLGFASASISITTAISGAVSVPFRYLAGYLSDRLGRKGLMAFCYLAGAGGLVALSRSTLLWHFAFTAVLQTIPDTSISLGSALVTDLVPQKALARGMSFFNATGWLAGMLGFAATGQAIQLLGMSRALIVTAALPLIAIALLVPIRQRVHEEAT